AAINLDDAIDELNLTSEQNGRKENRPDGSGRQGPQVKRQSSNAHSFCLPYRTRTLNRRVSAGGLSFSQERLYVIVSSVVPEPTDLKCHTCSPPEPGMT